MTDAVAAVGPRATSWRKRHTSYGLPYPEPSSAAAASSMRGNRSRDTSPEIRLRSLLHRGGCRFRKDYSIAVAGTRIRPDIVFPSKRLAVFVDGCFWHGCPSHGGVPRTNSDYWGPKLARNAQRDILQTGALRDAGWYVIRLWEHVPSEEAAAAVMRLVKDL